MASVESPPQKRKRTKKIAVIRPWCTGCGGAPVCMRYCRTDALILVPDEDHYPFVHMRVDSALCIGCGSCVTAGKMGIRLSGCPWDAIALVPVPASQETAEAQ